MAQVQLPGARKRDGLTTILRGLQIASQVYGIKDAQQKSELLAQQSEIQGLKAEETRRQLAGEVTPQMRTQAETQGVQFVPKETPGAQRFGLGQSGEPLFAVTPEYKKNLQRQVELDKAAEINAAKIAREKQKSRQKMETDLRKEYNKASGDNIKVLRNYKKVEAAANNPNPTGATDVNLVFSFMKTLDPGSVVREGEFATAENTSGIPGRVLNLYNRALEGQRLTPQQRQAFLQEATAIANSQLELQTATDERFTRLAKEADVDVEDVIDERFGEFRERLAEQLKQFQPVQDVPSTVLPQAFGTPQATQATDDVINKFLGE